MILPPGRSDFPGNVLRQAARSLHPLPASDHISIREKKRYYPHRVDPYIRRTDPQEERGANVVCYTAACFR